MDIDDSIEKQWNYDKIKVNKTDDLWWIRSVLSGIYYENIYYMKDNGLTIRDNGLTNAEFTAMLKSLEKGCETHD